jgi:hypothetical protein
VAEFTPGPWRWEVNAKSRHVNLCGGKNPFDLIVVDFVRWGMNGAAPRFRTGGDNLNVMKPVTDFAIPVAGREHHAKWFQDISHPDARLIAAAPDLLAALRWYLEHDCGNDSEYYEAGRQRAIAAVCKAEQAT